MNIDPPKGAEYGIERQCREHAIFFPLSFGALTLLTSLHVNSNSRANTTMRILSESAWSGETNMGFVTHTTHGAGYSLSHGKAYPRVLTGAGRGLGLGTRGHPYR